MASIVSSVVIFAKLCLPALVPTVMPVFATSIALRVMLVKWRETQKLLQKPCHMDWPKYALEIFKNKTAESLQTRFVEIPKPETGYNSRLSYSNF